MASQQQSSSQQSSRSYYPVDIQPLIDQTSGNFGSVFNNVNSFLNNPLDSSYFKNTIGSILSSLLPSEDASRTAVADQFRMAGGGQGGALQSGAFSNAVKQNERNILDQRGRLTAQTASDTYRNILSGLGLQLNSAEAPSRLLGNIRPLSEGSGSSQSSGSSQDAVGGGGGYGGGGYGGGGGGFLSAPNLGYTPGIGLPNSYGSSPGITGPNYDPNAQQNNYGVSGVNFAGLNGASGFTPQYEPSTGFYQNTGVDEYGYTPADWASDPYYQ